MKTKRKARHPEAKAERRTEALRAAASMFDTIAYAKITMADVAVRAGLAKGTVYLYFESKEELFLGVLEDRLFAWYDVLDQRLDAVRGTLSVEQLLGLLVMPASDTATLTRLLAIASGVLEHNIGIEAASRYKPRLWAQQMKTGAKLEAKWPHFRNGEGFQFLGHLGLFIMGARQFVDLSPVMVEVIDKFDLKGFRVDFDTELGTILRNYLRGLEARPREARAARATRTVTATVRKR